MLLEKASCLGEIRCRPQTRTERIHAFETILGIGRGQRAGTVVYIDQLRLMGRAHSGRDHPFDCASIIRARFGNTYEVGPMRECNGVL